VCNEEGLCNWEKGHLHPRWPVNGEQGEQHGDHAEDSMGAFDPVGGLLVENGGE